MRSLHLSQILAWEFTGAQSVPHTPAWQPVALPREPGGGTCFAPVFDWMAGERRRPDPLLCFADADSEFPRGASDYPVLWVVKGGSRAPWGERMQFN